MPQKDRALLRSAVVVYPFEDSRKYQPIMRGGRRTLIAAIIVSWNLSLASVTAFQTSSVPRVSCSFDVTEASQRFVQQRQKQRRSSRSRLHETTSQADDSSSSPVNGGGGLVAQQQEVVKTQLFSAFTNLGVADQYDAVLTGLCAKILDDNTDNSNTASSASVLLQDCTDLLQEMNEQKIAASPRSLMAMIDSTAKTQDAKLMAGVVSQCLRNPGGLVRQYGAQQADLLPFPNNEQRVRCPDGQKKTRRERLDAVADVPTDDRGAEIASAAAFVATAGTCELTNVLGLSEVQPIANLVLTVMVTVTAVDNFYDLLKTGSQMAVSQLAGKVDNKVIADFKMPEKASLPLGLGSGTLTGSVVRGLTRLVTADAEREAQCEAAALYTAYVLGLPCFAFRPNALEASVLVVESYAAATTTTTANKKSKNDEKPDNLLTSSGILRMLVWLMAAPAMESMTHPQLIVSDPREADGFLRRLEDYYFRIGGVGNIANSSNNENSDNAMRADLFWLESPETRADLLKWAYTEADLLLRTNKAVVTELSNRLTSGAATIGDCVAVAEAW